MYVLHMYNCAYIYGKHGKGSFNNYMDKKREEGVIRKSTLGHVIRLVTTKNVQNCPLEWEGGQNWVKFGPHSC